jgi:hypothetical protein
MFRVFLAHPAVHAAHASERYFTVGSQTENCAVHSGNPAVSPIYPPTPPRNNFKALNRTDKT